MISKSFLAITNPLRSALFLLEGGGAIVCGNKAAAKLIGQPQASLTGKNFCDLVSTEREEMMRFFSRCLRGTSFVPGSLAIRGDDGTETQLRCDAAALAHESGGNETLLFLKIESKLVTTSTFEQLDSKISRLNASHRSLEERNTQLEDIVAQRTAALAEAEARTRAVIDTAPDCIISIDAIGTIQTFNASAERCFGYSAEETIGNNIKMLMPSPDHERHDGYLSSYLQTGLAKVIGQMREAFGMRKDGGTFPIELTVSETLVQGTLGFTGIVRDVTERMKSQTALEELNRQLQTTSRHAGMAEIATGVLHNVGNVLNSVNVTATLMSDKVRASKVAGLVRAAGLLDEHADDLAEFLTKDTHGRMVPQYLTALSVTLSNERSELMSDFENLCTNVEHIKRIVSMQQTYAGSGGAIQKTSISELLEDALNMNLASFARHEITVVREYADLPMIEIDKHCVLQILVNLVGNARRALADAEECQRRLSLRTKSLGDDRFCVDIIDNGVGIAAENMSRVFAHGFTTKTDGHGFGLHSAANTAREMGGSLVAHSDGPGRGATFTLELPIRAKRKAKCV